MPNNIMDTFFHWRIKVTYHHEIKVLQALHHALPLQLQQVSALTL